MLSKTQAGPGPGRNGFTKILPTSYHFSWCSIDKTQRASCNAANDPISRTKLLFTNSRADDDGDVVNDKQQKRNDEPVISTREAEKVFIVEEYAF